MRLGKTDSDYLTMISTLMKGTGTFTDDQIDYVLLMPVGSSFEQHINNLVSRGEITEAEKGQILDFYRVATSVATSADKYKFPEDDMKLPDSNGNITTVTNKNYWWLYLALGVGLGLMFKKKK